MGFVLSQAFLYTLNEALSSTTQTSLTFRAATDTQHNLAALSSAKLKSMFIPNKLNSGVQGCLYLTFPRICSATVQQNSNRGASAISN